MIITITYLNDELAENPVVLVKTQYNAKTKYCYGNERLCTNDDFYLYDGQGSVTILLSGSNKVLSTYSYSDYGRRDKKYNPFVSSDEYGYRSEAHNSDETQYLRARYYDTVTELFISADGYRGDWQDPLSQNRYNYGRNNPNKYFDPTGKWSVWGAIKNTVNKVVNTVKKTVNNVVKTVTKTVNNVVNTVKNTFNPPKKSTPTQNVTNPTGARTAPPIYSKYDKAIQYTAPSNNNNNYNNNGSSNGGSGGGSGSKSSGKNTTAQSQADAQKAAELLRQRIEEQHGTLIRSVQKASAGLAEKDQRNIKVTQKGFKGIDFKDVKDKIGSLASRFTGWCESTKETISKGIEWAGEKAGEAWDAAKSMTKNTIQSFLDHPVENMLIAAGGAAVLYLTAASFGTLPVLAGILGHTAVAGYAGATVYSIYEYNYVDKEKGAQDLTKVALSTVGSLGVLGSTGNINAGGTPSIGIQGDGSAALSGGKLIGYTLSLDAAVASDPAVSAALGITQATITNGEVSFGEQSKDQKPNNDITSSLKKVKNNKEANKVANEFGYEGAEELKQDYVFKDGAKFNMMIDTETGEIVLVSIKDSKIQVRTGLFR
ncbi:RHS repeat domain-containing protein [Holdemania massiliensis]|uniref:RHS repeat domain-containing protein n=1 Tax=Holdemania massiliensis TaxID=1468449 RepID=UPI001F06FF1E|nr:RHS repeat-associated core domain-containing protein [Holdemania massiliensis]MCH1939864.1 hypothetical protein [Holdemania massiliensis]